MIKFYLILFILMSSIAFITRYLLKYTCEETTRHIYSKAILFFDIFAVFGMSLGYGFLKDTDIAGFLIQLISIAFMSQVIFDVLLVITLILRWIKNKIVSVPYSEERRKVLKHAAVIPAAAVGASLYASVGERLNTVVNRYSIPIKKLPLNLQGVKIAQLSDIHLGPFMDLDQLRDLMRKTASLGADILVITGDLFDDPKINFGAARIIDDYVNDFPKGIYYCYGNHEHIKGIVPVQMALEQTNITVLNNTSCAVDFNGDSLYLAGVDYPMQRDRFTEFQDVFIQQAMKDIPEGAATVLLAHHPDFFDSAMERHIPLTLSGHTHGGQIGLFGIPMVPPVFKYMRGMYQSGDSYCYVHVGNGSWFPYRLGCPPEIAVFTLEEK